MLEGLVKGTRYSSETADDRIKEEKNRELEKMNKLFVGRELRMVELKERIKELEKAESEVGGT